MQVVAMGESTLTDGQLRKLNPLRRSVACALDEEAVCQIAYTAGSDLDTEGGSGGAQQEALAGLPEDRSFFPTR